MAQKSRGAQPGNTNALKHGFYSRFFKAGEVEDIQSLAPDLTAEIAMLRVVSRRLFDRLTTMEDSSELCVEDYSALTSLLSASTLRIATIMRANYFLTGNGTNLSDALIDALTQTVQELNLQ